MNEEGIACFLAVATIGRYIMLESTLYEGTVCGTIRSLNKEEIVIDAALSGDFFTDLQTPAAAYVPYASIWWHSFEGQTMTIHDPYAE